MMPSAEVDATTEVTDQLAPNEEVVLPLYSEDVVVSRRKVARSLVRVATVTRTRDQLVEELLTHERVEIEHVPVGHYVDAVPPVRVEGDTTVMPVVEEVVVVERKLLLREEVHIRRIRTTEQHLQTVKLREQEAVITRSPAAETPAGERATPTNATQETE